MTAATDKPLYREQAEMLEAVGRMFRETDDAGLRAVLYGTDPSGAHWAAIPLALAELSGRREGAPKISPAAQSALLAISQGGDAADGQEGAPISAQMYDRLRNAGLIERWSPKPFTFAPYVLTDGGRAALRATFKYGEAA